MQTMIQKCSRGAMKSFLSSAVVVVLLLFVTVYGAAEEVTNVDAHPSTANDNGNHNLAMMPSYHPKVKRAWNQLHAAGWGKRSENEIEDESGDQLQQRLMRMYADQLLANRVVDDDLDYVNGDYDVDKRAKWSQLQNGWGKRDWNQLRGSGGWGKRKEWGKLQSAWGRK